MLRMYAQSNFGVCAVLGKDASMHLGYIRQAFASYEPAGTFPENALLFPYALSAGLEGIRRLGLIPTFGHSWTIYYPRDFLGI